MSWQWRPYVPVAQRRINAAKALKKMGTKGRTFSPVTIEGRTITTTFWGKAWCDNLEAYSDYANRMPRGRTYVRNGSVVDLQVSPGKITAIVSGSELYKIEIKIVPLPPAAWRQVIRDCSGKIGSLMELLQGKLSTQVMEGVTRQEGGLFPKPKEISLQCSCPDWAGLCKHVAASLYGVGARLDSQPELLFLLRGVDPAELISKAAVATTQLSKESRVSSVGLGESDLADVFGIEMVNEPGPKEKKSNKTVPAKKKRVPAKTRASKAKSKPVKVSGKKATPKKTALRRKTKP